MKPLTTHVTQGQKSSVRKTIEQNYEHFLTAHDRSVPMFQIISIFGMLRSVITVCKRFRARRIFNFGVIKMSTSITKLKS